MFTYFNYGEPLLVVHEQPKFGEYPDHEHVVHQTIKRRRARSDVDDDEDLTAYHLYSKRLTIGGHIWEIVKGIHKTRPTHSLNVNTLIACARNPKNEWGIIDQGTLEQMNARAPQQLEELWKACGASPTSLLSIEKANSIVNGASTCVCNFCPFPTQVRIASSTTIAEDSSLAF